MENQEKREFDPGKESNNQLWWKGKVGVFATLLLSAFAISCSTKSPEDIVSGIRTDGANRREAHARWAVYQSYEQASDSRRDIEELRLLQEEESKTSQRLTNSRKKWIRDLWRAERSIYDDQHNNSLNGNSSKTYQWDPTIGQDVDDALEEAWWSSNPKN